MPSTILVRHGQASFGEASYDRLSELGEAQARVAAADLAGRAPRIDLLVSGSLARQQATAAPIAAALGVELEIDPRWNEYDSDEILTHHSTSAARQDRPPGSGAPEVTAREFQTVLELALLDWMAAGDDGPCAETWPAFNARTGAALAELASRLGAGQVGAACTSGGVLAALCTRLLAVSLPTFVTFNRVTVNAGITRVLHGRSGATLLSFNEQSHLLAGGGSLVSYR